MDVTYVDFHTCWFLSCVACEGDVMSRTHVDVWTLYACWSV